MEPLIRALPTPVLIDHMGRPDVEIAVEKNDYFQRLLELGASRDGHLLEGHFARPIHAFRAARKTGMLRCPSRTR